MLIMPRLNSEGWVSLLLPCQVCSITHIGFCNNILAGSEFPPLLPSWNWQRMDVNKYPSSTMNCANSTRNWESSAEELTQLFGVSQVLFQLTCFWEWSLQSAISLRMFKYCFGGSWRSCEQSQRISHQLMTVNIHTTSAQTHSRPSCIWQRGITFDSSSNDALGLTWFISAALILNINLIA